jgi:hypothetical protein
VGAAPFDFDLPDYGEVGKRLRERACAFPYDDEVPAVEPEWEGECGWDVPARAPAACAR